MYLIALTKLPINELAVGRYALVCYIDSAGKAVSSSMPSAAGVDLGIMRMALDSDKTITTDSEEVDVRGESQVALGRLLAVACY